jgi:hypothetical protein
MFERYNIVLQKAVEKGLSVPFGMYALTKPDMKLVPTRITVDFSKNGQNIIMGKEVTENSLVRSLTALMYFFFYFYSIQSIYFLSYFF